MLFGLTPTCLSRYLAWGLRALDKLLADIPACAIVWPSGQTLDDYRDAIAVRQPLCYGAFGFCDGLRLPVATAGETELENAYYCGWTHGHFW